jgi:hypothetical protein
MPVSLRTSPGSRHSGLSPLRPVEARPRRALSVFPTPDGPIQDQAFVEYFRCPLDLAPVTVSEGLSADEGFFTFGDTVCYGRSRGGPPSRNLVGAASASRAEEFDTTLPFDLSEIVRNLREERYTQGTPATSMTARAVRLVYYFFRPILPVSCRKHLQKVHLHGWDRITFPRWPVDVTVERLMQSAMTLELRSRSIDRIPFIWFWPDGAPSCAIMTHDVEGAGGRAFCERLMDIDDSFGIKSSFQIVPETPRNILQSMIEQLRVRGFEVNLHDLNHDGRLFESRGRFMERVAQINRYAREFDCHGFRSGAMYREQAWFDAFELSFDMSVPNGAHLEPQRGGCCTVMPYFVGNVLELPLTTIQDYSLFHILGDYSTRVWKEQIDLIRANNGLISFIAHPDYLRGSRAQAVYTDLLRHLSDLRDQGQVWMALPTAVDQWWRNRQLMSLVPDGDSWRIVGPGSDRARLAYAALDNGRLKYYLERVS